MSPRLRNWSLGAITLVCFAFTGAAVYSLLFRPELFDPPIGGPFTLVDVDERPVTEADFAGRYMLVYFGYTYCPDVCPTELFEMTQALETFEAEAPAQAARVTPVFITVDPARDTPQALSDYMAHFHPRFVALTGPEPAIAAAADAYQASYGRVAIDEGRDYLMDHTSYVYLMGPDGRYMTHFTAADDTADKAKRLAELVE